MNLDLNLGYVPLFSINIVSLFFIWSHYFLDNKKDYVAIFWLGLTSDNNWWVVWMGILLFTQPKLFIPN